MEKIRVILADDHEIVRNGIRVLLESEGEIEVIGEAADGAEALQKVKMLQPDILIVDIRMPILNGIETASRLHEVSSTTKALVLSMHDDEEYIIKSVEGGASGYLLKDTSKQEFVKAVKTIHDGHKYFSGDISNILVNSYLNIKGKRSEPVKKQVGDIYHLTKREKQILQMIHEGISNKEIATQLSKSVRTVETHRFNIMKKLGVNNITELLLKIEKEPALKEDIFS